MSDKWIEVKNENMNDIHECRECGKKFIGYWNKYGKYVPAFKQMAGHIMSSNDHHNKKWAGKYLRSHLKKHGLEEW